MLVKRLQTRESALGVSCLLKWASVSFWILTQGFSGTPTHPLSTQLSSLFSTVPWEVPAINCIPDWASFPASPPLTIPFPILSPRRKIFSLSGPSDSSCSPQCLHFSGLCLSELFPSQGASLSPSTARAPDTSRYPVPRGSHPKSHPQSLSLASAP